MGAIQTSRSTEGHFQGRVLFLARAAWIAVALLEIMLIVLNVLAPAFGSQTTLCPYSSTCGYAPTTLQALQHAHISTTAYNIYLVVLSFADALITAGLGVLIFWRKSDQPSSLLASFVLLLMGAGLLQGDTTTMPLALENIVSTVLVFCSVFCIGFFIVAFPDGRLVPRWSWVAGSTLFVQAFLYQLPGVWYLEKWPTPLYISETILAFGSPVAIQIYRYVRVSNPAQRQQTRWVIFGLVCSVLILILQSFAEALFPSLNGPGSLYPLISFSLLPSLSFLLIPLSIGIAILRSRLWDIDTLINKALVYGSLTATLVLLYAGLILGLQALLGGLFHQTTPIALVVSTLAIAALFQPVRTRIQAIIDRRFYRKKYDAERVLAAFSATLHEEVDLEQLRERLVSVIQETMQPESLSLCLVKSNKPEHSHMEISTPWPCVKEDPL